MNLSDYLRAFEAILEIENRDLTGGSLSTEEKARIIARRFYTAGSHAEQAKDCASNAYHLQLSPVK